MHICPGDTATKIPIEGKNCSTEDQIGDPSHTESRPLGQAIGLFWGESVAVGWTMECTNAPVASIAGNSRLHGTSCNLSKTRGVRAQIPESSLNPNPVIQHDLTRNLHALWGYLPYQPQVRIPRRSTLRHSHREHKASPAPASLAGRRSAWRQSLPVMASKHTSRRPTGSHVPPRSSPANSRKGNRALCSIFVADACGPAGREQPP
jgi:hypothetical protein